MPPLDESCVLIPAVTLEDFPSDLSDYDARSLLAAWTVLWHPQLLAHTEQIPAWYRADGPPEPIGRRLIAVPAPSLKQLPAGYEHRARGSDECRWISGESREQMLAELQLGDDLPLVVHQRRVSPDDFFAAGYAYLQIQVMTRRLRYTSNLDEIHLQTRMVAAAKAYLEGDGAAAIEALHDVFDCLAEERDHYFSSDPHLIDLTLTSESTVERLLEATDLCQSQPAATTESDEVRSVLPTPPNLLIDSEVAEAIAQIDDPRATHLRQLLSSGQLGWAGGGPAADVCLDGMSFAEAESVFCQAQRRTSDAIGSQPAVYGRFSGATPSDMTRVLVKLGYCGMIPLDFANGSGHGDEAKVIVQAAGAELEALTAKPVDASSDASFLTLGTRLGEAVDSGEIATGLLVHWPGQVCDAFGDLQRVASWSLSLGRFWKLDDYFRDGEHPYHHGTAQAASPTAGQSLDQSVEGKKADPISSGAAAFCSQVVEERDAILIGMTDLVTGRPGADGDVIDRFAQAVGGAADGGVQASLLINPHSIGCRETVTTSHAPPSAKHVFASSSDGGETTATVDIPACGFVSLPVGDRNAKRGISLRQRVSRKLFGGPKLIAEAGRLENEFMQVQFSPETGGISGVYSGGTRGNRFSMRLVNHRRGSDDEGLMRCSELRIVSSTAAGGCIEARGEITDAKQASTLAKFSLRYSLARGSRVIKLEAEIEPSGPPTGPLTGQPWQNYIAARVAVVTEASIFRPLLRDKVHRARSRRLVAPLGVLIDEAERQTLVAANGLAFHRRVDDRFLDTLLCVEGESRHQFTLHYGFDVANPVTVSRALIAPPKQVPINADPKASQVGWIVHTAPKDLIMTSLKIARRSDGKLAAILRVIQTRSQSCKAAIRFFRDVDCAVLLDRPDDDLFDSPLPVDESAEQDQPRSLACKDDMVSLSLPSHGVADILVIFQAPLESTL
jgi:hypothetical protein